MSDQNQLDRIEDKLDEVRTHVAAHRTEIKWLKACMSAFFATTMAVVYKVWGK